MGGSYSNRGQNRGRGGGGGAKEFKADPLKQYLIARGCSEDRAVELCCSGKIALADIPDMTDKLTILRIGKVKISPEVDREMIRIAGRVAERTKVKAKDKEPDPPILCDTCLFGPRGTDECADGDENFYYDFTACDNYASDEHQPEDGDDLQEQAAAEKLREKEEAERQAAEDEASEAEKNKAEATNRYHCTNCTKTYKTARGLENHVKKEHS